jgi:hypothetical protein
MPGKGSLDARAMHIPKPSSSRLILCHCPEPFFKDLQTKSPEIFHPCSCVHQRWFTFRQLSPCAADPKPHRGPEWTAAIPPMRAVVPLFRRFDSSTLRRFLTLPQHMPTTSVGTIPEGRVSPYVTFDSAGLAREQCACLYPRPLNPLAPFSPYVTLVSLPRIARNLRSEE